MRRSSVDLPPPDGPMTASVFICASNERLSMTGLPSKLIVRPSNSSFIRKPPLEVFARGGNGNREDEIQDAQEQIAFDELQIHR